MSRNNIIVCMRELHASWMHFNNQAARRAWQENEKYGVNQANARRGASFKLIVVIYGGKRRSCLKRERVFKMRETMPVQRSWVYAGKPRPRSRSSSFLPVYRSHAAMSNVVKIPLLHPINYLRFPELTPRRSCLVCFGEIIGPPRAENRQSRICLRFLCLFMSK